MVSMILLGLFGFVQLIAVARHYVPLLRAQYVEAREREQEAGTIAENSRPAGTPTQMAQTAEAPSPALVAQAAQLVAEADRHYRVGDFEAALRALLQAGKMLPSDAAIQFRFGQVYEALNDKPQAFASYERSIAVPGLPPEIRRQAEQKMALLAQSMGDAPPSTFGTSPANPSVGGADGGQAVRDSIGLQPGSALGIVETRLQDSQPGAKILRIAVKSRPGSAIDPQKMNVHVFFYETDESGEIVSTEAKSTTQWISPPVDWKDEEPELLDVEYPMPDGGLPGNSAEFGALGRKFYGYMVGVYYNGELQDSRADPGRLDTLNPLPLILEN